MLDSATLLFASIYVPPVVTLVCACLCAYLIGSIPRRIETETDSVPAVVSAHSDQSKHLADKLVTELEVFRSELIAQQQNVAQLRNLIDQLSACSESDAVAIDDDTQEMLRVVSCSISELPHVFSSIQQSTTSAVQSLKQVTN